MPNGLQSCPIQSLKRASLGGRRAAFASCRSWLFRHKPANKTLQGFDLIFQPLSGNYRESKAQRSRNCQISYTCFETVTKPKATCKFKRPHSYHHADFNMARAGSAKQRQVVSAWHFTPVLHQHPRLPTTTCHFQRVSLFIQYHFYYFWWTLMDRFVKNQVWFPPEMLPL